jgi:hypothetical protein
MPSHLDAKRQKITRILVIVFCAVGLMQLTIAVREALRDKTGDLGRQWNVIQYVRHGVNPYPIALDALLNTYGVLAPRGPVHLRDADISDVPKLGPNPKTDPALGTPEATYPPGSLMMLLPLGSVPRDTVAVLWICLNLVMVVLVGLELKKAVKSDSVNWLFFVGLVATWPAAWICIQREQFSLLCMWCVLLAYRMQRERPILAGLLYSVAFVKPSMAIPFMVLPLFDQEMSWAKKIQTLVTLGATQVALLGAMCWMVRTNPTELIAGWLRVAGYFRQGIYTVQEAINRLRLDGSAGDFVLQLGVLFCGIALASKAQNSARLGILAIVSCLWTYHARYDFVILLIPAALLTIASVNWRWAVSVAALVFIGIGLLEPIYHGTGMISSVMRMAARLSMLALLVVATVSWLGAWRLDQRLNREYLAQ